jgi:hypothetical protein
MARRPSLRDELLARPPSRRQRERAAAEQAERTEAASRNARTTEPGPAVSTSELALHLDMGVSRVAALSNDGTLPRNIDGSFPLDACRVAYIRFIRAAAASRARTGDRTTPLIETKTLKAKLELAVAQGSYVNIDDVELILTEAVAGFRNHLSGIGASVTRDLALRAQIEEKINDGIAIFRNAVEAAASAAFRDSESDVADEEAAA